MAHLHSRYHITLHLIRKTAKPVITDVNFFAIEFREVICFDEDSKWHVSETYTLASNIRDLSPMAAFCMNRPLIHSIQYSRNVSQTITLLTFKPADS